MAPDEQAHVDFLRYLVLHRKLLVQLIGQQVEAWQPPLYYLLGGTLLTILNIPGFAEGRASVPDDIFGYQQLRLVSTAFGLLAIVLFYRLGRSSVPRCPLAGVGAAALAGLLLQFAFLSNVVNNDNAVMRSRHRRSSC